MGVRASMLHSGEANVSHDIIRKLCLRVVQLKRKTLLGREMLLVLFEMCVIAGITSCPIKLDSAACNTKRIQTKDNAHASCFY